MIDLCGGGCNLYEAYNLNYFLFVIEHKKTLIHF